MTSSNQRGGTLLGFIFGLVVGLTVALGVAVYITKVPIPFMNKGPSRSADQEAAEDKKNKDWDPNAPLYGKNPARGAPEKADPATQVSPKSADPLGDLAKAADAKQAESKAPESKSTEGKTLEAKSADAKTESGNDPFLYFVQAGAYRTTDEAEAQRVKLVMMGFDAKISERDQGGRTVYRVRMGPLQVKADAERVRDKLEAAHIDSALVRVQR